MLQERVFPVLKTSLTPYVKSQNMKLKMKDDLFEKLQRYASKNLDSLWWASITYIGKLTSMHQTKFFERKY